jgi:crystallin alpha B
MSRVPLTFRDWWDDYDDYFDSFRRPRTSRLIDQHFGTALRRNDLLSSLANTHISSPSRTTPYYRPWSNPIAKADSGSTINVEKDKFQIILDVQQFTPEEISVKTTDKFIVIEGGCDLVPQ